MTIEQVRVEFSQPTNIPGHLSTMSTSADRLVCNSRGCLHQIERTAWVTLCSHVFCAEHGRELKQRLATQPARDLACPCCGNPFRDDLALVERKLDHSVQFRAMQLCGYNPEVVMEIATTAIAFWNYQKRQLCANLVRKSDHFKEAVLVARKERDEMEVELRRVRLALEQTEGRIRELEQRPVRNKRVHKEPVIDAKKRRKQEEEEDDFLN